MAKNNKILTPNWHPNFRLQSELPDIKVIRTDFIINGIAAALILFSIFTITKRELDIRATTQEVAKLDAAIAELKPENDRVVQLSESFRESTREIQQLENFYDVPFDTPSLLKQIADIRPDDIVISSLNMREVTYQVDKSKKRIRHNIKINGNARDLITVSEFKNRLESEQLLIIEGFETDVQENIQPPNTQTGLFPYEISIQIQPNK